MFNLSDIDLVEFNCWQELESVGIGDINDLINPANTARLKEEIQQHIRACNLSKDACEELLKAFKDEGFEVRLDQGVYPEISFLPTSFSNPLSEEDWDDEIYFIEYDEEQQRALNYASWIPSRMSADKAEHVSEYSDELPLPYPLNLISVVFGGSYNYRSDFIALCTVAQEILADVLDTLTPRDNRLLELIYKEGISIEKIVRTLDLQNHKVALWAIDKSIEKEATKVLRKLRRPVCSKKLIFFSYCMSYLENVEGSTLEDIKKSFLNEQDLTWATAQGEESLSWSYKPYKKAIRKFFNKDDLSATLICEAQNFNWCSWPAELLIAPASSIGTGCVVENAYFSTNPALGQYLLAIGSLGDGDAFYGLFEVDGEELHDIQIDVAILKNLHQTIEKIEKNESHPLKSVHILHRTEQQFRIALSKGISDPKEKAFYQTFLELIQEWLNNLPESGVGGSAQITIDEMNLSVRTYNCLKGANIYTLDDLSSKTEDEVMKVRNLGRKSLGEIICKMSEYGVSFRSE